MNDQFPNQLDHLVFTAPDLQAGMDSIEALLGTRPVIGGQHPKWGTHNALLSLGNMVYLEVIAPDPTLPAPTEGRLLASEFNRPPHLATWVLRSESIDSLRNRAVQAGVPLGPVEAGQRQKPDGSMLQWKLSDPHAFPNDGLTPFLISWGNTPHPSASLPVAGSLHKLILEHPDPETVTASLSALGVDLSVLKSDVPRVAALIQTENGLKLLD